MNMGSILNIKDDPNQYEAYIDYTKI